MRKRYFAVTIATMVVLGICGDIAYQRWARIPPSKVEQEIRDHVRVGTSRDEVVAYLDSKKLTHFYVGNSEFALVAGAKYQFPVRTDIQIRFNFDRNLTLVSYSVKEIHTEP
jgi:hypothetical protein